jgi:hypothetical protein
MCVHLKGNTHQENKILYEIYDVFSFTSSKQSICRSAKVYAHGLKAVFSKGHLCEQRLFFLLEQKTKT